MSSGTHDVSKMVGIYKKLFMLLIGITVIGIVATLFLHVPVWVAILMGMAIMVIKGKVVLDSFQHLITGRTAIIILFGLTAVFFVAVLILPILNHEGRIVGTEDIGKQIQMDEKPVEGHHHGD